MPDGRELRRVTILPAQRRYLAELSASGAIEVKQDGSVLHIFDGQTRASIDARGNEIPKEPVLLKKIVQYEDLNGEQQTEEVHFHMSRAQIMELIATGEIEQWARTFEEGDKQKNFELVKGLVRRTYGVKSEDGKKFNRDPELYEAWTQTEAYSHFIMSIAIDADEGAAFFNGLFPPALLQELQSAIDKQRAAEGASPVAAVPELPAEPPVLEEEVAEPKDMTALEQRVLADKANGQSNLEIATHLGITEAAVEEIIGTQNTERKVLTAAEVEAMDSDELKAGLATGKYVIGQ